MYSVKLFRVGTVSIHINKLEPQRNGGEFIQQDGRKVSVNRQANILVNLLQKKNYYFLKFLKSSHFIAQYSAWSRVIDLDKERFQGFWISIRNNVDISIGRIGDKLVDGVANFTDVLREGPEEPYYFGLTTPSCKILNY